MKLYAIVILSLILTGCQPGNPCSGEFGYLIIDSQKNRYCANKEGYTSDHQYCFTAKDGEVTRVNLITRQENTGEARGVW